MLSLQYYYIIYNILCMHAVVPFFFQAPTFVLALDIDDGVGNVDDRKGTAMI